jgi:iron(III) transport system permease protein
LLGVPILSSLYGTTLVLIIVLVISAMTSKIQILRGNLMQVGQELEDASRVCGSGWLYCFRTVVLPLVGKAALVAALLGFVSAARNVSHVALLTRSANRPLSMLQLDYLIEGRNEPAAIIGVVLVILSVAAAVAVRFIGFRTAAYD